jgi:hypothetical protein
LFGRKLLISFSSSAANAVKTIVFARRQLLIDILIDFEEGKETFDNFMAVCTFLDALFEEHKVEVVTAKGLSPYIGPHILNSVEYVQIAN